MIVPAPTERQILYGLVAAGFHIVTAVLATVAAATGLSPRWWTAAIAAAWVVVAVRGARRWRDTGPLLGSTVGLLLLWTVGALLTR